MPSFSTFTTVVNLVARLNGINNKKRNRNSASRKLKSDLFGLADICVIVFKFFCTYDELRPTAFRIVLQMRWIARNGVLFNESGASALASVCGKFGCQIPTQAPLCRRVFRRSGALAESNSRPLGRALERFHSAIAESLPRSLRFALVFGASVSVRGERVWWWPRLRTAAASYHNSHAIFTMRVTKVTQIKQ